MIRGIFPVKNFQSHWQQWLRYFSSDRLNIALIAFGIILRLKLYLTNNSFRLDEDWLALDISTRTFSEIISAKLFSYDLPAPPPGFSLIEKVFITLFGNNEYAFRLFPLLCGIASLFLFYRLLKKFVSGRATSIALFFFVCSDILIYNSSQLKQYSSGVFVVLLLYHLMAYVDSLKRMTVYHAIQYGLAGSIAIMLFYPSALILAGIGITQVMNAFYKKEWERSRGLLFSVFLWSLFFITICLVYCYYMFDNQTMQWPMSPYPVWSTENLKLVFEWLTERFLVKTAGLVPFWLGLYFILIGIISLLRRKKNWVFALGLPIFIVLLAVTLKIYPARARFFLAFLPGILIIFAHGAVTAMQCKRKNIVLLNGIFLAVLFVYPIKTTAYSLMYSYSKEEIKPLMRYLKKHRQSGDALFINNSAQYAYIYYLGYYRFTDSINPFIKIVDHLDRDEKGRNIFIRSEYYDFDKNGVYKGIKEKGNLLTISEDTSKPFGGNQRTWVLLTHIPAYTQEFILELLGRDGVQLKKLKENGSFLYLYDLSAKSG